MHCSVEQSSANWGLNRTLSIPESNTLTQIPQKITGHPPPILITHIAIRMDTTRLPENTVQGNKISLYTIPTDKFQKTDFRKCLRLW